jgi:chemotaxis protein MotB
MPHLKLPEGPPTGGGGSRHAPQQKRHAGGAWKVAYADFVTALLALFIVLWLMNSTRPVKQAVSGYFKDPRGYTRKLGAGPGSAGEGLLIHQRNVAQVQAQIEQALRRVPEFQKMRSNIQFSVTGEGLRIDLLENELGLFFVTGKAEPTMEGTHLLAALAQEMAKLPNRLVLEGHTDARPFRNASPLRGYGNWELSADRANVARRLLHQYGVRAEQVAEVRGFADQRLLIAKEPQDPRNRRISVVVIFPV